jgi:hypothetical protein
MSCIIITIVGVLLIRWNIHALEVNEQAYSHLLLACASGFALAMYVIHHLINRLTEPQRRPYNFNE